MGGENDTDGDLHPARASCRRHVRAAMYAGTEKEPRDMLIVAAIVGIWALSLCSLALTLPPEFFSSNERNDATENGA
jgi:hypothetical protein